MNSPAKPDGVRTNPNGDAKADRPLPPADLMPPVSPALVSGGESALAGCTASTSLAASGTAGAQAGAVCEGGTPAGQGSSVKIDRGI